MTKSEFLERLTAELARNHVADAADIAGEYEQHFAFKLADGFSEEEIAAKLGDPTALAAQFCAEAETKGARPGRAVAVAGLCCSGVAVGVFFVLLAAWGIALAAFSICAATAAVGLIAGISPWSLLPPMPYGAAVVTGVAMAALAVLSAVGCVWFVAFLRRMIRVYGRFQQNTMAAATGKAVLPSLSVYPSFQPAVKRRLRRIALVALTIFAAFFVLGMAVSICSAGTFAFWHAWGWFGYRA